MMNQSFKHTPTALRLVLAFTLMLSQSSSLFLSTPATARAALLFTPSSRLPGSAIPPVRVAQAQIYQSENPTHGRQLTSPPTINTSTRSAMITSKNTALAASVPLPAIIPTKTCGSPVCLKGKVLLDGPFSASTGLMSDTLRLKGLIPQDEPYTALGYSQGPGGGGERLDVAALSVSGNDAIVDWVFLQLRNASDQVVASRSALLQRDGDIVDMDGTSNVGFDAPAGDYIVTVRHRNHLGVMTANAVTFSAGSCTIVDFTSAATDVYNMTSPNYAGSERRDHSGVLTLWAGDANGDGQVAAAGVADDTEVIKAVVLNDPGNTSAAQNYISVGYKNTDVNLDGRTIYAGPNIDKSIVLLAILTHPLNPTFDNNFIVLAQYTTASSVLSQSLCTLVAPDLTIVIGQPSPSFVVGLPSNVPLTVTNAITAAVTTGPITATMTLPIGTSAPPIFTNGVWTCSTTGLSVICIQPGPITVGGSSTIQVPVTPTASTVRTPLVPFNASTSTPGEINTSDNTASFLAATVVWQYGIYVPMIRQSAGTSTFLP